uniref:Uncharacterized protein n=1 Tax=Calidris pygmaea TaxID=425635 RepID=A0A8C3J108_9CHAR
MRPPGFPGRGTRRWLQRRHRLHLEARHPSSCAPEVAVRHSAGRAVKLVWTDCEGLCWNLAGQGLGEKPHADSYSAGQFSASFGSFTQPCTQWLHKADYKLQRIPEGAKSDAGANEPREPLIPVTEWDKLGKAWTTQIQGSPGSSKPALGTGDHYPLHSAGTQRRQRHVPGLGTAPGALHNVLCSHRNREERFIGLRDPS